MNRNSYWITAASQKNWEAATAAGRITIVKDSVIKAIVDGEKDSLAIDNAFIFIHKNQSASIPWATAYEGWRVYPYKDGDVVGQEYQEAE